MKNTQGTNKANHSVIGQLLKTFKKPGFWLIVTLIALITLPHYAEALQHPAFLTSIVSNLGLSRHAFERIAYLAPIVWAGFMFGWKGSFIVSLVALGCMLPRAIFYSQYMTDAIFETIAVFIIGNVLAVSFNALRKEREQRSQLEVAHQELRVSEQRYRELFENALDAIWIHDLDGNIIAANRAGEKLSGYTVEELTKMNVRSFLSDESLELARQIRNKIMNNEPVEQPYEQRIFRKDGSEAIIQLVDSPVFSAGQIVGFQHIARDVTEQKRLQENLHFYLHQATRAQEEERKRISHELHDETIQDMIVLSRKLDNLASSTEGLSEENRLRLEEVWQQTDNILRGIRRLSQDLRPAALDRLGLLSALEWLAADITEYSGIVTKVNVRGKEQRLPEEVELMLFRITQEALRNVWRHSGATSSEITVAFEEDSVKITISDNGKGFKLPEKIGDLARDGRLGLAGMQERAQLVGGTLTVQSEPGKGSTVTIEIDK